MLWKTPPTQSGRRTGALAAFALLSISSIGYASSITAYRDPSGRVIFVNEPEGQTTVITATETQAHATDPAPTAKASVASAKAVPATTSAPVPKPVASAPVALPKETESAAETPTADPENSESRKSIPIASTTTAATTAATPAQPAQSEPRWDDMGKIIEWTASRHAIDPDLIRAIVRVESNFNPRAMSRAGAGGLMQLIPETARRFGVSNVFDPKANLDGGVRYLKHLMNQYGGDLKLSLAAYNAGESAVDRHNGVPPFPETRNYLRKIAQTYPLDSNGQPKKKEPSIAKYIDASGVIHFTNAE